MLLCKFCSREFSSKNGISQHESQCKLNPQRTKFRISRNKGKSKTDIFGNNVPWNKGLTKDLDDRVKKYASSLKGVATGKGSTIEKELDRVRKITKKAMLNNGGLRQGSGRGKKGWYKGFFCDSSWELAFVVYCIDKSIHIEKCKEIRWYEWEGKQKRYYPDFIVDGKIIEIKGYKTKQWETKLKANPDIIVLYEKDLKLHIDYVTTMYGKEYTKLYEENRVAGQQSVLKTDPTRNG